MKKHTTDYASNAPSRRFKVNFLLALLPAFILGLGVQPSHAGSATWNLNPISGHWNTATNWTPATVPNRPGSTATFDVSNTTDISIPAGSRGVIAINGIVFNSGASAFTIRPEELEISGAGITNNAGITETFVNDAHPAPFNSGILLGSNITFLNNATVGSFTSFVTNGGDSTGSNQSGVLFRGTSSAGSAVFTNNRGPDSSGPGGSVVDFLENSTASNATFINHGGTGGFQGGATGFSDSSTAAAATLIADVGSSGAYGGYIAFVDDSTGGTSRVQLFGDGTGDITNGSLSVESHNPPGVTIGSLEGSGVVLLGASDLSVGSNDLSVTFSGAIQDGANFSGGSLSKTGKGKLTLTNANTYTGGTTVTKGTLIVKNTAGSATGGGPVQVNNGTLQGVGKIDGVVTVGNGTTSGAILLAGNSATSPGTLTVNNAVTFQSLSTYKCVFKRNNSKASKLTALGVTINSNATFTFLETGTGTPAIGTVYTVINNTSANPIAGTFSNLPNGTILTTNGTNLLVKYNGGNGNDLTLTVQ